MHTNGSGASARMTSSNGPTVSPRADASFLGRVLGRLAGPMLPTWDGFVDGRGLADAGSGPASPLHPPSPPHPPCLPDWATTPEMPCLGPTPTSLEKMSGDDSTTILAFAVMGLVGVIGLTAFARERSRELHQGNQPAPRLEVVDVGPGAALRGSQRAGRVGGPLCSSPASSGRDACLLNRHRSPLRSSPPASTGTRRKSEETVRKGKPSLRSGWRQCLAGRRACHQA